MAKRGGVLYNFSVRLHKKSMIKIGSISLITLLFLALIALFTLPFFSSAQTFQKEYVVGEKIQISFSSSQKYELEVVSPSSSQTLYGKAREIIFVPEELGPHTLRITHGSTKKSFSFQVVSSKTFQDDSLFDVQDQELASSDVASNISDEIGVAGDHPVPLHRVEIGKPVTWVLKTKKQSLDLPNAEVLSVKSQNQDVPFQMMNQTIALQDNSSQEFEIMYTTPAPVKEESVISDNLKIVKISSENHYTDVKVTTAITELVPVSKKDSIRVLWNEANRYLSFTAVDQNDNGFIDGLEWNAPHMSNQTFQIIIKIISADHLDSNKVFIRDIFGFVSERDGNWTLIPDGDFVRVTFERNLTSENDITLYAKSASNESAKVEVYEKDSSFLLATFENILAEGFYKIFLTSLTSPQDTFDLKVLGSILLDYIVDPIGDQSTLAQIYQTNVLQNAATEISVQFNNETVVGSNFSHPINTNLQFLETGWYKVSYGCIIQEVPVGGGARTEMTGWLDLDGVEVLPSRTYTYLRDSEDSRDRGSLSAVTLVNITAGSNLTLQLVDFFGAEQPDPEESCWLSAERLSRPAALIRETTDHDHNINATDHFTQDFGEVVYEDTDVFTADLTNNWISVDVTGWYKIYYVSGSEQTSGTSDNDRITPASYLYKNDTAEVEPSMTYSYHKRSDQAAFSSEEGFTMAYLNAGENISLRRFALEIQQATANTNTLNSTWLLMEKFADNNTLLIWDTSGGQGITGSTDTESAPANITWDSQVHVGANYSHAIGEANFTIDQDGWFEISYAVSFDGSTGANRKISCAQVVRDGSLLEPSKLCEYLRDSTVEDNSVGASFLVNNSAGSEYVLQHTVTPQSNNAGHTLIADSSWIVVNPVNNPPDLAAPDVIIIDPPSGTFYASTPIPFNVSTNEVATVWYSLNGGVDNITMTANASNTGFTASNTSLADGNYNFSVYANDSSGNNNFTEYSPFTLDTIIPDAMIDHPQNTTYNTTVVSFNFTATDLNRDSCWYTNDSGVTNNTLASCANISYTAEQDSTTLVLYINDSAGNTNSSNVTFFVDSIYPLIAFAPDAHPNNTFLDATAVYTNVTVTETNEDNITFNLYNSSGGLERTNTFTDGTRYVTWSLLDEGLYTYNVSVYDIVSNTNATETRTITLDTTDPTISYESPTQSNHANVSQNWIFVNVSVTEANEANITFNLFNSSGLVNSTTHTTPNRSINWTSLPDGTYTYNVTVFDFASQSATTTTRTINLDTVFPLIDYGVGTESDGANFTRNWVFVNVSVTESAEANITFELFNLGGLVNSTTYPAGTRTINWTGLSDAAYFYNVTITDYASNQNATATRQIGIDDTGPSINLVEPQPKAYSTNTSLSLNYTVSDNVVGTDSCWWNLDNGANTTIACGTNTTFNTSDGAHTLFFYSNDTLGNNAQANVTFLISTTGPAITLVAPADDSFFSTQGNITFNWTASSPAGISECNLYGDWNGSWHLNYTYKEDWWNQSWAYRNKLNITTVSNVTDEYTVDIAMDTTGDRFLDTGDDVRVTYWNGSEHVEIDRLLVRPNETDTRIQFQLQSAIPDNSSNENYTIYFGNPSAGSPPANATAVWLFYDDFSQGNLDNWAYGTGTSFINTSINNTWTGQNSTLQLGVCSSAILKVNDTIFTPSRDLKIRALWLDNPGNLCSGGSPDADGILGLRGSSTTAYDGLLVEWDTDTGFHYDVGAVGSVPNDFVPFDTWVWTENFAYGTAASGHHAKHWNFTEDEPEDSQLNATSVSATSVGVPFLRVASGTAIIGVVFASILVETEPTVTIQHEDWNASVSVEINNQGTFNWNVLCTDNQDQGDFALNNFTFGIDTETPLINYTTGTEVNDSNFSRNYIFVNVTVVETNEQNITFELFNESGSRVRNNTFTNATRSITWTSVDEGVYYYNVTVVDKSNRANATETRTITLDVTGPTGVLLSPPNASYQNNATQNFTVNVSDDNELANATLFIYNSTGQLIYQATRTLAGLAAVVLGEAYTFAYDGIFTWFYRVTDFVGNTFTTGNRTVIIDTTNPTINFTPPTEANATAVIRNWIFVNTTINETNFANITFNLFKGGSPHFSNTFTDSTRSINWTLLADDTYVYNVTARDLASNQQTTETRTIILDNVAPVIAFNTSTADDNANVSQNWIFANVSVTEVNEANITFRLFNASGLANVTTYTTPNRSINWTGFPDGNYSYNVTVTDLTAQSATTTTRSITLDTALPVINYISPTQSNGSEVDQTWVFVNVSVTESTEANITFQLFNASGLINATTFAAGNRSINWTGLPNNNVTYSYNVTVTDHASNQNTSVTRYIELVDLSAPELSIVLPITQNYTINESIPFTYTVSDPNLEACWYNLNNGTNITLGSCQNTTLDVADEQQHTLYLYANDTLGQTASDLVTFFVNTSLIVTNDWKVERGTATVDGSQNVTLSSEYAPSKSFILHTQRSTDSGPDSLAVMSTFPNETLINFQNYVAGGGATVEWEVVTGPPLTVTRNVETFGTSDTTFIVSAQRTFNLSNSFIIVSTRMNSGTASENQRARWTGRFVNATSIELTRGVSGDAGEISWQAVEWRGAIVQNGSFSVSATSGTQDLANSANLSTSFLIFSSTTTSASAIDYNNIGGYLVNETRVGFYRQDDDTGNMNTQYFVVSSPIIRAQRDSVSVTSATVDEGFTQVQNTSKTFLRNAWDATGSGTTFANGIVASNITSTTNMRTIPGTTAGNVKNVSYQIIEIESIPPAIAINDPNNQTYATASIDFNVTMSERGSCLYSLTGGFTNYSMSTLDEINFYASNTSVPDGSYTVHYYCTDEASNRNETSIEFSVDSTFPRVEIDHPQNTTYNTTVLSFNFTATDLNRDSCWYTNNSGVTNYSLASCNNITYTAIESSTTLILYANDSAGNTNSSNVTFFVDSIYPLIDFSADAYQSGAVIAGTSIYTNVSVTELNEDNITFTLYNASDDVARTNTFTDSTRDVTWTLLAEGYYYYNVTIVDVLNNRNTTEVRNITLDNTDPAVSYESPTQSSNANVSQDWVFVNVSVTETNEANVTFTLFNSSGLANQTTLPAGARSINWTSLPDGNYSYNVTVYDLASQNGSTATRLITLDTTTPLIDYTTGTEADGTNVTRDWIFINVTVTESYESNITFELFDPSGLVNSTTYPAGTRSINWTSLPDEKYQYNVTVFDSASNQNTTATRNIGLDNTGPVISIDEPQATTYGYNVSLPLNYSVFDYISNLDSCWWHLDNETNNSVACNTNVTFNTSDGAHTVYVYANDSFNNIGSAQVAFTVSVFGPAIVLHDPANDTFYPTNTTEVFFNYTPTDPDDTLACSLYGSWAGGWHRNQTNFAVINASENNFTLNISGEGAYIWNVECNDSLDFYSFAISNRTLGIDITNPTIDFSAGTEVDGANKSQSFIFVNVTVNETNERNITFRLFNSSGSLVQNNTYNDSTRNVTWTSLTDGTYSYNVTIIDKAGYSNTTSTRTILLDTFDPSGTLLSPSNGSFQNNATQNFTVNVSDDNELANATLFIYNSTGQLIYQATRTLVGLAAAVIGEAYTFTYDGIFTWFYRVTDFVGNTFTTQNNTVIIDTSSPGVVFVDPTEANGSAFTRNWVFANVTLNETNFENVTFRLYRAGSLLFANTFTDNTRSINWTLLIDETYVYNVTVTDQANNVNATETRTIILDNVAPIIAFNTSTADDNANVSQSWIFVNVSVTEVNEANLTFNLYNASGLVNSSVRPGGTRTINWTNLGDGNFSYNVTIYDLASQSDSTTTRSITLDATLPTITYISPTEANGTEVERDWIFVNVSVVESTEANITFSLFNASDTINITTFAAGNRSINWTSLATNNVTYSYNVTVTDHASNQNTSLTRYIRLVDLSPPVLTLVAPENQNYTNNESVPLQFIVVDANTDTCWYNLDSGANVTLPSCQNTTFAVADEQTYNLTLYANDTLGQETVQSVVFEVNTSLIVVNAWYVQRSSTSVDGSVNVQLSQEVPPSKSFILHTQRSSDSGPDSLFVMETLANETTMTLQNYATGEGATVEWEVVTGPPLTVSRNVETFGAGDSTLTVSALRTINLSDTFLIISTRLNSGTTTENQRARWTGRFINTTDIELNRGVSGDAGEVSWQAVSWSGATVQNGSFSLSATSGTQGFATPVDLSESLLIFSSTSDSGTALDFNNIGGYFTNTTGVSFYRQDDDAGTMDAEWFVVSAPIIDARRGSFNIDGSTSPEDNPFAEVVNTTRTAFRSSWDSTGSGDTHANAIISSGITNSTNIRTTTGTTGTNVKNVSWQVFEIIELDAPEIDLSYPADGFNQTGYTISQFNYSVTDESSILNCSLYGNWTASWHANQTVQNPATDTTNNFSSVNLSASGFYIWNVECRDAYQNTGFNQTNFTIGTFIAPEAPVLINASQDANDGQGNITLLWNQTNHTLQYNVYYAPNLSTTFTFLNQTQSTSLTDTSFAGNKRRFYLLEAVNPIASNNGSDFFGAHVYTLNHNSNTRNWIGFPTNFTYLQTANQTRNEITNATTVTLWNETIQGRVTCNEFSCPSGPSCTDTNCNFGIEGPRGYEVNINASAPSQINWSGVGIVYATKSATLEKNATSFGKNWISLFANTTFSTAQQLFENITGADAVSKWNTTLQTSQGLIFVPAWNIYVGTNFNLEMEQGYEVSVNQTTIWNQ